MRWHETPRVPRAGGVYVVHRACPANATTYGALMNLSPDTPEGPALGMLTMAEGSTERRLSTFLAADIAGQARTVRDLKGHQAAVLPMVVKFGGRVIDTAGDGILAEFPSAVNAVKCAVDIQAKMAERNVGAEP